MTLNVFLEATSYVIESCYQCWKVGIIKLILCKETRLREVKPLVIDTQRGGWQSQQNGNFDCKILCVKH